MEVSGLPDDGPVKIVLADDHVIVREGIRALLEAEPRFRVVAEAGTGDDAARYALGHKPDILILDLSMPGTPSLELVPKVAEASPRTAVIVLTMHKEAAFAREALSSGVSGYVIKHAAATELVAAINAVLAGGTYINPQLGAELAAGTDQQGPPDELTPREIEVLGLIALGHTNPEIAEELVLSVRTIETHRANIQRKTGHSTRAELVAYAHEHGLVDR